MKTVNQIHLTQEQRQGLSELHSALPGAFDVISITLFGSTARGESEPESDTDLLIITGRALPRSVRHQITDIVFDINLRNGTNFSTLVVDRAAWDAGLYSVLPLQRAGAENNTLKLLLSESYRNAVAFGFKNPATRQHLQDYRSRAAE